MKQASNESEGTPLVIAAYGAPHAVVVVGRTPSRVAAYAAKELSYHVELATGVALPVVSEHEVPEGFSARIYVGVTRAAAERGIDSESLAPDEALLRRAGAALFVLGKEDPDADPLDERCAYSGTLFGVYELLERFAGVRWLWPGKLGTYVPRTHTLAIPGELYETVKPRLAFRTFRWGAVQRQAESYAPDLERLAFSHAGLRAYRDDLAVYLRRHRLGRTTPKPPTGHAFSGWWKRLGKDHPEWFALNKEGTRGPLSGAGEWGRTHVPVCVSNPELHRYIVEEAWDGGDYLPLGEVDERFFCQCDACRAWDGPQPAEYPDFAKEDYEPQLVSDRYARFWLTVQAMAARKNPKVKVTTFLYWNNFPAPLGGVRLDGKVYAEFVPWTGEVAYFPMSEAAEAWLREQWLGWQNAGAILGYRPNYFHGGYVMPYLSTRQAGRFFKFAYEHGMVGADFDSLYGHWAVKGPMLYLHMRLLWNPELDVETVRKEYFAAFGPAAEIVERYFDYWEERSLAWPLHAKWRKARVELAYPEEYFPPAEAMLEEALSVARTSPEPEFAERVRFLQAGLAHARLSRRFLEALDEGDAPKDPGRLAAARRITRELVEFRRAHEHLYVADFLDAAMRENAYWGGEGRPDFDPLFE